MSKLQAKEKIICLNYKHLLKHSQGLVNNYEYYWNFLACPESFRICLGDPGLWPG